jgi:hypothetical protein
MIDQKLGRFEIIREIGKGAMGVVYLAHDPRIDRKIAIKMIAIPSGVSPVEAREARHRFVREAQAAGRLAHPNIITIYDVVEESDRSYIAMEYIDGETLESHTKPGALLPLEKVLGLIAQACTALDYAHQNLVIHRDIKPANLMLVQGDVLKITDFGLAKSPDANLTQDGVLIGTPNYMSPEQISGKPMDGRSDFFSLGVVLYELVTGERPFGGDTISTIIYRILYEEPRPPRIVNEKLPPAFDQILRRALAKEPAQRFQTGAEFADALTNYSTYHLKRPLSTGAATLRVGREKNRPTPPRRLESRERILAPARAAAEAPMFAGQPFKVAAFIFVVVMALILFPRRIQETKEKPGSANAALAARQEQDKAGFGVPSFTTPALSPPSRRGLDARLITTQDTKLWLNNKEYSGPTLSFDEGDTKEYTLLAENGCRQTSKLIRPSELAESYDLTDLQPKVGDLRIDSLPPHAEVYLDGKLMGKTPLTLSQYNACDNHTVMLKKEGSQVFQKTFDGSKSWREISNTLDTVSLSEIPSGYVKFEPPPPYPVEVTLDGKKLPTQDNTFALQEGEKTILLKSPGVLYQSTQKVSVAGGKTVPLKVNWRQVGKLIIQAEPSNCRIFVDDVDLGYPPLEQSIVTGDHVIRVVPEADPEKAQSHTVTIEAGVTKVEKFGFNF